jgi:hypothetical protein
MGLCIETCLRHIQNTIKKVTKMKRISFVGLLIFLIPLVSMPHNDKKKTTPAESITQSELCDHVFFLASDEIGGRIPGTSGYEIAAKYAAGQFRAAGLQPVFMDADGKSTYFQEVPLVKRTVSAPNPFTIRTPEGVFSFSAEENIRFANLVSNKTFALSLPIIFIGYGIEEQEFGWNDLQGLDLEGKIAVMMAGTPTHNGKPVLPDVLQKKHSTIQGILDRIFRLSAREDAPKALIVISSKMIDMAWENIDSVIGQDLFALSIDIPDPLLIFPFDLVIVKSNLGRALFKGQTYDPFDSIDFNKTKYRCYELRDTDIDFEPVYKDVKIQSWNVAGMAKGTDPSLSDQYLTVGAHLDTVVLPNGQICNGADDNASGCSGILEIAEAVGMAPFRRPVMFTLWTAEEGGAFGSQYFVQNPPVPLDNIEININFDMIGRSSPQNKESRTHLVEGFDKTSLGVVEKFIEGINEQTVKWPLSYVVNDRLAGSSDHASFYKKGIPVIRFYSGHHDDVHMPSDDAERIDYDKMEKISQLTYWIIRELADGSESIQRLNSKTK